MDKVLSNIRAPAVLWLAAALAAMVVPLGPVQHVVLAVAAGLTVAALPQTARVRAISTLAMLPIAFSGAPAWTLVAAGGLLAVFLAQPSAISAPSPLERIQRHLEWCRRRNETSHLLWVHAPQTDRARATAALDAFRVTDAAALLHEGEGREELVAMVDAASFEREGLERRLRAQLGEDAGFGWASFPDDGVTLDALFQHARAAAIASTTVQENRPSTQLGAQFRRLGTRSPTGVPARSSNQG